MAMQFTDALTLDKPRITRDGFMAVRARAARSGIYEYLGREVDPQGKQFAADAVVRVYRPADEVFAKESVASFTGKPITDDHPAEPVTADNWRRHARGAVMGAMRDGEYLSFDLALMDAALIGAVNGGKRELSNGYSCDLDLTAGTTPDGQAYDAVQRNIRGNHIAVVDMGRAGAKCRIGDAADGGNRFAHCDANPTQIDAIAKEMSNMAKYVIDGLTIDLADPSAVAAALDKLTSALADAVAALASAKEANDKAAAEKDAEIEALKAKEVGQEEIDRLADAKAAVIEKGRTLLGDKLPDLAGKSLADSRRAIVAAKLGDAVVADRADAYVEARFDLLDETGPAAAKIVPIVPAASFADSGAARDFIRNARY